jgi:DNA polymerase III subunit gamma/tau
MENQPLHIKYRPKSFEEFIGNDSVIESLKSVLYNESIRPHTYLFTGPSGCGKTTLARILKTELGCSDWDFTEMNTANTRGIDSIREVISNCGFASFKGNAKVYLFDEAAKLTNEAQNALLKIIEDTPSHVYFILSTTDPEKLLKTIRTRCSTYQLRPLQRSKITRLLRSVCEKEGAKISVDTLKEIARVSEGSPRQALVILGQVIGIQDPEEIMKVIEEGSVKESQVIDLCRLMLEGRKEKWKEMSELLKGIEAEPETVRYAVLGYLNTVLLNRGDDRVVELIELFSESFMYSGKAGLTSSCFLASKVF